MLVLSSSLNQQLTEQGGLVSAQDGNKGNNEMEDIQPEIAAPNPNELNYHLWQQADNKFRRVPPRWKFPYCTVAVLRDEHWLCGDNVLKISQIKRLSKTDVDQVERWRHFLSEVRHLIGIIGAEAQRQNIYSNKMSRLEAKHVYKRCNQAIQTELS